MDIEALKERRARLLKRKEYDRLRSENGESLAASLARISKTPVFLKDFRTDVAPAWRVHWLGRVEEVPGLVAAYITKDSALEVVSCIASKEIAWRGSIGILDNEYLGVCCLSEANLVAMIEVAELVNDTLVFCPEFTKGAIVVDHYSSIAADPFSIVVQGEELVSMARDCFK